MRNWMFVVGHRRGRHRRPRAAGGRASRAVRRSRAPGQARDGVRRHRSRSSPTTPTSVHAPGAAWGIVIDGELAHQGTMGVRDVASKAPVDADTVFRIASMTKSFTAMSILKLRDAGKLSLDDPAERYVPELKNLRYPTTDSPRITVRHLLTHSEGFPEDNPWGDQQLSESEAELSRMLRDGIPFSNAPGVAYEYSNYGFAILGRIVSRVSGKPYDEYVAENILKPLGMTSTTLHPSKVAPNRLAIGYRWEDERWKEEPALPHGSFGAMGGMLTSIRDLSRYVSALSRRVAAARWTGDRSDPPRVAPRDAAALASLRHARRPRQVDERHAPDVDQLRLRPERHADLPVPRDRRAQRRPARLRIADALAARLRRRHHRLRQRHLHRLEQRRRRGDRSARPDRRPAAAARSSRRRRSSRRATTSRSSSSAGTMRWRTRLPPRTCSSIDRRTGGARRSTICAPRSAPAPRRRRSTSSRTRCAGNGR